MKGLLLANVSNKETYRDICSNLGCLGQTLNISNIISHKK